MSSPSIGPKFFISLLEIYCKPLDCTGLGVLKTINLENISSGNLRKKIVFNKYLQKNNETFSQFLIWDKKKKYSVISWLLTGSIKCRNLGSVIYHKVLIDIEEYQENYRSNFQNMRYSFHYNLSQDCNYSWSKDCQGIIRHPV